MLNQPDYLKDIGPIPRRVCMIVVGFFAFLFLLMSAINTLGSVILAIIGPRDLLPIVAGSTLATGILGAGLLWIFLRLRKPRTQPGNVAVFPLWFIQVVGFLLLPATSMASFEAIRRAENLRILPLVIGPPLAMILVPWLVRRRLARSATPDTRTSDAAPFHSAPDLRVPDLP